MNTTVNATELPDLAAMRAVLAAAKEVKEQGTFNYLKNPS